MSAGIAHELQNPLAFMQKFADVSMGLIEQDGQDHQPGLEQTMMDGLRQNLRQISQQGQRASAIIADMLAHARTSPTQPQPQPTDLNALVAEYLLLADHGPRTPNGPAAVELHTSFGFDVGLVPAVPPEIGRALLNRFTNALHAVRQRQQASPAGYQPTLNMSTRRLADAVEITVRDNGTGMAEAMHARIFQPFFTTKPATEGTGLGLALAHDTIVKGHHGTLSVQTREGEFTEFRVRLPT